MSSRFDVVWTDTALHDLLDIVEYLADRDRVDAAEHVHAMIADAVRGLGTMPERCRVVPELDAEGIRGYRELLVGPYRIMLVLRDTRVVMLTVLDGRRDLAEVVVERALRGD